MFLLHPYSPRPTPYPLHERVSVRPYDHCDDLPHSRPPARGRAARAGYTAPAAAGVDAARAGAELGGPARAVLVDGRGRPARSGRVPLGPRDRLLASYAVARPARPAGRRDDPTGE